VLGQFRPSKSQRRVLRRNADLTWRIQPTIIDDELKRLFAVHKQRFKENVPASLEEVLGAEPADGPCENVTLQVRAGYRLVAASFLDLGRKAASSVYGMFAPSESRRSLGICTMLWEIAVARDRRYRYYYPGYACHEPSLYDYKKQFGGLEWFDWQGKWHPLVGAQARL
jgi:arginine-tRNA-protein transferase